MIIEDSDILFSDNHLIAINKKAGQIVQGDKTGDTPLNDALKMYVKTKFNKPGDAFLGTIHRIDRPVSGVVLFARTSKALTRMNELFKTREVQKSYLAIVKGVPQSPEGTLIHWMNKNEQKNKSYTHASEKAGTLRAELFYSVAGYSDNYTLLKVEPVTGRHHQIRAQLAAINLPIKGDLKYGARRSNPDASICLHAWKVKFTHPVNKSEIEIIAPLPKNNIWQAFESIL